MKKPQLIFVPAPGVGHIVSTIEFSKCLLNQDDHITVTVLVMKQPTASFIDSYLRSFAGSDPRIQLIQLPDIIYPPQELRVKSPQTYFLAVIEGYKPHVRSVVCEVLLSRADSTRVVGLVLDFFCASMIDVGNEFGVPSYMYFTSGAGFLSFMLSVPDHYKEVGREFKFSDSDLSLPSFVQPVPVKVLPSAVFRTDGYDAYLKMSSRFREMKGIVLNTFVELESHAINSLSDGQTPPIYHVGPVFDLKGLPHPELDRARWDKIMKWLDEQTQSSVLFLCFGSSGSFSAAQVEEIALGLDRSGCRFLWSLRAPPGVQDAIHFKNPEEVLPEGFLERIGKRGIVCGWAPQIEVLSHKAIGGFVSHCGWNSTLESLWYGVPMVTLPIYAEQQMNAFLLVRELEIAEELKLDYRRGHLVKADEIERSIKRVMQSDNVVRVKVKEIGEMARKAVMEDGSSYASLAKLIKDVAYSSS